MAVKLGQPFMPWQRYVADVGGEIDPYTGLPAYREVVVTIPRQSGKTILFLTWQINRCVSRRWRHPQRSAFTAQTGKDARDKWIDELFPLIRNSAIRSLVAVKGSRLEINEGMGNESILFKTGSRIRLLSTSTSSGHSKTLHQAAMDEVWHDTDDRREQGLRPAMITIQDAQLLVCSTAGTDESVVLNRKVDAGRAAVAADVDEGVAYFEWSAPEGWNPDDEDSYLTFMPALCPDPPCRCAPPGEKWRHTITLAALRAERAAMKEIPGQFKRAYGNVKTSVGDDTWQVITEADWTNAADPNSQAKDPVVFAINTSWQRTHTCIAAVGEREDHNLHGVIVEHRPHGDWPIPRMVELALKWKPAAIVLDPSGATNTLTEELNKALRRADATDHLGSYLEATTITAREAAAGWGMLYDALSSKRREDPDPALGGRRLYWRCDLHAEVLTTSVRQGTERSLGEGRAWECKVETDMSPVKALTDALYGFVTKVPDEIEAWVTR